MVTQKRRRYPSDISEFQWRIIERMLPEELPRGRQRSTDLREVVNAIHYRWRTGCVWRMLPHDFPPWETVYAYFQKWQKEGLIIELRDILIGKQIPEIREISGSAPDSIRRAS